MKILFKMTGSIAMFKACGLISKLVQAGHEVQVVASASSLEFVGSPTLEGLSRRPVLSDLWEKGHAMDHIHLVRWADLIVVAPASAHFINRIAQGLGDDLLTTMFLAHDFKKPYLVAPAMNTSMYLHPATQDSLKKLKAFGVEILESASGVLACGEAGYGRLLEVDELFQKIIEAGPKQREDSIPSSPVAKSKLGKVLVTAGGTSEPIDDVRMISNKSTGRTGSQIADHLYDLGFDVTLLVSQNGARPTRPVTMHTFETFNDLKDLMRLQLSENSISTLIHLAAVSDYSVDFLQANGQTLHDSKIPSGAQITLGLKPNPKLISMAKGWSKNKNLQLIGFKLTSRSPNTDAAEAVQRVLIDSAADYVVHNDWRDLKDPQHRHPFRIFKKDLSIESEGETIQQLKNKIGELASTALLNSREIL